MSTITAIRHLNPSARIISTSRTLDYADFELLQRLRIETPLPWRIAHALSRKLTSGDQPASPPPHCSNRDCERSQAFQQYLSLATEVSDSLSSETQSLVRRGSGLRNWKGSMEA